MTETHICEHCGARSAVYRRKINRTMVIGLMYLLRGSESDAEAFWSLAQGDPTHHRSRDTTRLALWGLIEEERVTVYDAYQERFDLREVLGTIDL